MSSLYNPRLTPKCGPKISHGPRHRGQIASVDRNRFGGSKSRFDLNDRIDQLDADWNEPDWDYDSVPTAGDREQPPAERGGKMTHAEKIVSLIGPAVLLNVRSRTKAPTAKNWPNLAISDMTPGYLASLTDNIGVSLGTVSNGLYTIDCDEASYFDAFLAVNPILENTHQSHGARGGNFWIRCEGEVPKSGKLKDVGNQGVGEWRGDGNQTISFGTHPSGVAYRNNDKPVITVRFEDLVWPDNWVLPWEGRVAVIEAGGATSPVPHPATRSNVPPEVVDVMLGSIPPRPDRDTWLKISASVRNSLGNDAVAIEKLKEWSPEEEPGEYQQLLSSSAFDEIGLGTLCHHAEANGFAGAVTRFFYNGSSYCMKGKSCFVPLTGEGAVKQHLTKLRVPKKAHNDLLCEIREHQLVVYMGPMAGHPAGLRSIDGGKVLVTTSPVIIPGEAGNGSFIHQFFRELLDDDGSPEQLERFLFWLSHCRRAVICGRRTQSPALAFTGGIGDGKSLAIEIIKRSLGGRSAKAYRFFSGDTNFNGEIIGAELLHVDDDAASKDHRSRVKLAQSIKTNLFSAGVRIEGKGRDAVNLDLVQALVFAVNNDPEHLRVLPELDSSMNDKILLMKTKHAAIPEGIRGDMAAISAAVDEALPAFLNDLDNLDMGQAYDTNGRLRCFWHPEIVDAIGFLSSEHQLLELIHQVLLHQEDFIEQGRWSGTAAELQSLLTGPGAPNQHSARNLLTWPAACGTYLGRLSATPESGVTRGNLNAQRIQIYVIEPR